MPDEEHAAGMCRALSLPIEGEADDDNLSNNNNSGDQKPRAYRAVVFKSVPAVWKSEEARTTGFSSSRTTSAPGANGKTNGNTNGNTNENAAGGGGRLREDEWVGLARALAAEVPSKTGKDKSSGCSRGTVTCDACAGFGCSWCDNGVVPAEEVMVRPRDEGLWQAALRPTS